MTHMLGVAKYPQLVIQSDKISSAKRANIPTK